MNRKQFLSVAAAGLALTCLTALPGCSNQQLSELKVGPSDQVVTYDVIGGM